MKFQEIFTHLDEGKIVYCHTGDDNCRDRFALHKVHYKIQFMGQEIEKDEYLWIEADLNEDPEDFTPQNLRNFENWSMNPYFYNRHLSTEWHVLGDDLIFREWGK